MYDTAMTDAEKAVRHSLDLAVKLRDEAYNLHGAIKHAYVETQLAEAETTHLKEKLAAAMAFIGKVASYRCECDRDQLEGRCACCTPCAAWAHRQEWED